jgi:hypothetical protein
MNFEKCTILISFKVCNKSFVNHIKTRTKTSIRYAKENDREKRDRRRDIEREGEIRERDVRDIERE